MDEKISRSRAEMETTIGWTREDNQAWIYSCDPVTKRKLDRLCEECPDAYKVTWVEKGGGAKKYSVSSRLISFRKPPSEAVREAGRAKARLYGFRAVGQLVSETSENEDDIQ